MDEKTLKDFTKKRSELIASLMSSMDGQVKDNQKKLLEKVLEKFVDKLEKDENGNVKNNDRNRNLLIQFDDIFKEYQKKEARDTVVLLLQSVGSIINFNQKYFSALDGQARTLPIIPKVKDFMKVWLGIKGDIVEPNGYLDKLVSNDPAKIALKNQAMKIVIGQEGFEDAKKQIKTLIDGNQNTMGALEKHHRNFAFDLYSQIDRATSDVIRNDLGFEFAVYEGGIIESSRIFCEEHDGKIYHISEIKDFNPTEAKPPNYNPITDLGGYGCRHHLNWISTAMAKAMGKNVDKFLKGGQNKGNTTVEEEKPKPKPTEKPKKKEEQKKPSEINLSKNEKEALENYVSGEGMWINSYLRKGFDLTKEEKSYLKDLSSATSNKLGKEMTLYRSVDASAIFKNISDNEFEALQNYLLWGGGNKFDKPIAENLIKKAFENKFITEKGFMSMTIDKKTAVGWGDFSGSNKPIVLKGISKKETKGIDLSKHKMEQGEILLHLGQKYEIKNIKDGDGFILIEIEFL